MQSVSKRIVTFHVSTGTQICRRLKPRAKPAANRSCHYGYWEISMKSSVVPTAASFAPCCIRMQQFQMPYANDSFCIGNQFGRRRASRLILATAENWNERLPETAFTTFWEATAK